MGMEKEGQECERSKATGQDEGGSEATTYRAWWYECEDAGRAVVAFTPCADMSK